MWRGNRSMKIVDLQPDEVKEEAMELVAVGSTGWSALPKITIREDNGEGSGSEIRLVDGRSGEMMDGDALQVFVRP